MGKFSKRTRPRRSFGRCGDKACLANPRQPSYAFAIPAAVKWRKLWASCWLPMCLTAILRGQKPRPGKSVRISARQNRRSLVVTESRRFLFLPFRPVCGAHALCGSCGSVSTFGLALCPETSIIKYKREKTGKYRKKQEPFRAKGRRGVGKGGGVTREELPDCGRPCVWSGCKPAPSASCGEKRP